jgi:hypothetical protein
MPFGKNKRLSAPRPKKKKVEAREDAEYYALTAEVTDEPAEETSPPSPIAPASASAPAPALSPGGVKRQAAQDELDDLYVEFMAHEEVGAEAERSLALAERIYEAKERRLDAAQKKRKRNGSPFGESARQ